jgi:DNA-binding GntR family transcriptional regulator
MDTLTPVPKLIEQAYASILAAICDGQLQPGERLNQDELATRMNVSRQPVGQALSILKAQGFVRETGRRGLIVAPLERHFFRSVYELRETIDPMAARLAAQRALRHVHDAALRVAQSVPDGQ